MNIRYVVKVIINDDIFFFTLSSLTSLQDFLENNMSDEAKIEVALYKNH